MGRPPNTEARRQQIVEGLLSAIAANGYAGATIQSIASAAGLSPGLVHYHFASKHEILIALVDMLADYARARFEARAATAATPEARLRAYIDARLSFGNDARPEAVAAWVVIGAEAVRDADVREIYQRAVSDEMAIVRRLLGAYIAGQGKRARKLAHLAAGLLAYVEGAFTLASTARAIVPKGFAAELAMLWVQRYVEGEPGRFARAS